MVIDSALRLTQVGEVEDRLRDMDRLAVDHAVVAPPEVFVAVHPREGVRQLRKAVSPHRDRLSPLAAVNPWFGEAGVSWLREALEDGFAGLYVCPPRQGFRLTESLVDPFVAACAEFNRPVYCYMSTPVCAMPLQLAELARRHPTARFVLGHFGWVDFSGYDAIPAARQAANLFIETSCAPSVLILEAIEAIGPGRLLPLP